MDKDKAKLKVIQGGKKEVEEPTLTRQEAEQFLLRTKKMCIGTISCSNCIFEEIVTGTRCPFEVTPMHYDVNERG